jgi:putative sigma-54 modulation protein
MNINRIKGTNMELTESIKDAVEAELAALDPRLKRWGTAVTADVEVGKTSKHHQKGDIFRAEVNLQIPGKLLRAENVNKDLYVALKNVVSTLERELKKETELRGKPHVADKEDIR